MEVTKYFMNLNFNNYLSYFSVVISIRSIKVNEKDIDLGLISRRCALNAGTRFNVRGTDDEGNPANLVETEQILINEDIRCSYVQVMKFSEVFLNIL